LTKLFEVLNNWVPTQEKSVVPVVEAVSLFTPITQMLNIVSRLSMLSKQFLEYDISLLKAFPME
jgi:hypothetical protein